MPVIACLRRKALQPPTQSFASAPAKLCIRHRNALREKRLARKNYNDNQNENQNEDKNHDKPLEEDGGRALLSGFRFGLIRAVLLTPQAKAWQHLLSEGRHPLQGDKQK
ncbi:hypothetical protein [Prevotella sp. P3-122]|uniref:hypothetical protein n=1 Tax=Prevotella sp. P3-122 TaxID=2024223 RepID=UPI0011405254|nr:hypothetical protein [Prevotella sp. P3-122]